VDQRLPESRSGSRSALDDFLHRTVVHEDAGAPMPRALVLYALLGAAATTALGVLGIAGVGDATSGFGGFIHAMAWIAAIVGVLLIASAMCLSRARTAASRDWMGRQLVAGAVVPSIALVLFALYLLVAIFVLWLLVMALWVTIDS
jgi:hypothetical protein